MRSIESVEEQLQAIAMEIAAIRRSNAPGYMVHRSLEVIEARIVEVRGALTVAMSDLLAFYRVADVLAARMGATVAERAATAAAAAVDAANAQRLVAERVRAAVREWRDGERTTDALAAELPTWTRSESAYLVATHLRSVGVAPDEAEAAADAIVALRASPPGVARCALYGLPPAG